MKILFALAGLAAVASADMGVCQKNCAIDFGKCMIQTFDFKQCTKDEAACALDCLKGLKVETKHHHHHEKVPKVEDVGVCQKDCAIDFTKCMIQTFDVKQCAKDEASCALDCLKGVAFVAKYNKPVVPKVANKAGDMGVCQKNCGIDFGKCLLTEQDFESCLKAQASCSLDCFKSLKVETSLSKIQVKDMGVCQKNCGIDFGKCMIQTFDFKKCAKDEAACALDCLKGVQVKHHSHPHVKSLKCSSCQFAGNRIQGLINKLGCGAADVAIVAACEAVFLGPEDPLADICAAGFVRFCPTFASWIENKIYTAQKACQLIGMC